MTKTQWIAIMVSFAGMGCWAQKDSVKKIPTEKQAILHLTSGNRLVTFQDAEALQAALKNYFATLPSEQLKNQWPGSIAQSPHGIGPVWISHEGMVWIGRWVLQPSGDDLHLAYSITPTAGQQSGVEFWVEIRQENGKWKIIGGHGTETFGTSH